MVRVMIRVRIRFSVWLVSCYSHVFVRLLGRNAYSSAIFVPGCFMRSFASVFDVSIFILFRFSVFIH